MTDTDHDRTDGRRSDGSSPDGSSPDGSSPDGSSPDGGSSDGGSSDGGSSDGGSSDGGSSDDTVEITTRPSLADDLLRSGTVDGEEVVGEDRSTDDPGRMDEPGRVEETERTQGTGPVDGMIMAQRAANPPEPDPDGDDDYFEPETRRRSRLTTVLLVALIFALGTLTGVQVGRVLTPAQQPQIVYLLNDADPSAAPTPAPSTSSGPASTSAGR